MARELLFSRHPLHSRNANQPTATGSNSIMIPLVILLALDTCDARGSLSFVRDGAVEETVLHIGDEPYSSWLFRAARKLAQRRVFDFSQVDAFAVANGPGSFTGVRVGLTTVKAWAEVFARPIVAISRLEVLASESQSHAKYVAAFFDAHRGQVFGGLFARDSSGLRKHGDEMVGVFREFRDWIESEAPASAVAWISPDRQLFAGEMGDGVEAGDMPLAPGLGRLAFERLRRGETVDALHLDANYVRRSDAEVLWKGPGHVGKRP